MNNRHPKPLAIDRATGTLRSQQGTRRITPRSFAVLEQLLAKPGRPIPKEKLLDTVWSDTAVSDEVLTTAIYELRQALRDRAAHPAYIETLRKRGYRWIAPIPDEFTGSGQNVHSPKRPRIQGLAAAALLSILLGSLSAHAPAAGEDPYVVAQEACDLFLRGLSLGGQGTSRTARRAIEVLEQAAVQAPGYAPVHLALAESYLRLGRTAGLALSETREKARQAVTLAESAKANPADLYATQATFSFLVDRDPKAAERQLLLASQTASCSSTRFDLRRGEALSAQGRHRLAIALLHKVQRREPNNLEANRSLARALYLAGEIEEARLILVDAAELHPHDPLILRLMARVQGEIGDREAAWHAYRQEARALGVGANELVELEESWKLGGLDQVRRWRLENSTMLGLDAVDEAAELAILGDFRQAEERLLVARQQSLSSLVWVAVEPAFRELRG